MPILIDNGATIIESALVVEYLDKAYAETGTKLYPDDPALTFKVRARLLLMHTGTLMMHHTVCLTTSIKSTRTLCYISGGCASTDEHRR